MSTTTILAKVKHYNCGVIQCTLQFDLMIQASKAPKILTIPKREVDLASTVMVIIYVLKGQVRICAEKQKEQCFNPFAYCLSDTTVKWTLNSVDRVCLYGTCLED